MGDYRDKWPQPDVTPGLVEITEDHLREEQEKREREERDRAAIIDRILEDFDKPAPEKGPTLH
ncbi:MAG: hypothetical protein LRZ85_03085 [Alphaproteobacteria bacterium]|nr:hypothetical protein [Alphaproteobacteria bacterium]MCD8526173.1 hypothetical protein [Alphaproteobacteria bacterium]